MTTFFTKCSVRHRVEVWFGEVDQEHAENQRGSISSQPLHHLDGVAQVHGHGAPWQRHGFFYGSSQEEVHWDPGRTEEGEDEVQESDARGDHVKGSWDEVGF